MNNSKLLPKYKVLNTSYFAKYVPNEDSEGVLDDKTKNEIMSMILKKDDTEQVINLNDIRNHMGWAKANYESKNQLTIANEELVGDLNVRIYVKTNLKDMKLPTVLFIHGGGFFGGSLDNVQQPCRFLADNGDVRVISVDYGLAPENPYPKAVIQCYQALVEIHQMADKLGIDTKDITVMGDSAGATLTYTTAFLDREFETNYIKNQIVYYPVTFQDIRSATLAKFNDLTPINPKMNKEIIQKYFNNFNQGQNLIDNWYIQNANANSIYVSPLNASNDLLSKLPKTLFMVGEFDPLRLQGEAFYNKAKLAGCDITYLRYNGMIHAFMDKVGDYVQANDSLLEALLFIEKN